MDQATKYKIGISACFMYPDMNRVVFGPKSLSYIENDMAGYISKKNIIPVLIPDIKDEILFDLLEEMDGFVFQGGTDIAPESYGEKPLFDNKWRGDPYRDAYELKILDFAVKNDKPVLAICRGMQLLNVYFGGTLYQDITSQVPEAILHRNGQLYDTMKHKLNFTSGCILEQIYPNVKEPVVNTVHHQAIKDIGNDLEILATCMEDGIVEAISYKKSALGKVMGVQWHPEFSLALNDQVLNPENLFNHFLDHIKNC